MFKFLIESKKEFEHVVRPTNKETKKYFSIVTGLVVILTLFIYIIGTAFSAGLFALKDAINPAKLQPTTTNNTSLPTNLKFGSGSTGALNLSGTSVVPTVKTVTTPLNTVATGATK